MRGATGCVAASCLRPWRGMAWHGVAWHGMAWHYCMMRHVPPGFFFVATCMTRYWLIQSLPGIRWCSRVGRAGRVGRVGRSSPSPSSHPQTKTNMNELLMLVGAGCQRTAGAQRLGGVWFGVGSHVGGGSQAESGESVTSRRPPAAPPAPPCRPPAAGSHVGGESQAESGESVTCLDCTSIGYRAQSPT